MDNQKPVTAEDIAKMKKNGKTSLAVAAAVFVIVIIWTLAGGSVPTWLLMIVGISLALGIIELRKAKKAEAAQGGSSVTPPPTPPTPPSEPTV